MARGDGTDGSSVTSPRSILPRCSSAERTISSFASRWSGSSTCSQSQPPQRSDSEHAGARLAALASSTSRSSPRQIFPEVSSSTRTRSPGSAPSTKTVRPSCSATPSPSLDRRRMRSSISAASTDVRTAYLPFAIGRGIRQVLAQLVDEALDPRALVFIDVDELDGHSRDLVRRVVELVDPHHPAGQVERERGVGQRDDQAHQTAHRMWLARVDVDAAARDVRRPIGDEAVNALVGHQQLVMEAGVPTLGLGLRLGHGFSGNQL